MKLVRDLDKRIAARFCISGEIRESIHRYEDKSSIMLWLIGWLGTVSVDLYLVHPPALLGSVFSDTTALGYECGSLGRSVFSAYMSWLRSSDTFVNQDWKSRYLCTIFIGCFFPFYFELAIGEAAVE